MALSKAAITLGLATFRQFVGWEPLSSCLVYGKIHLLFPLPRLLSWKKRLTLSSTSVNSFPSISHANILNACMGTRERAHAAWNCRSVTTTWLNWSTNAYLARWFLLAAGYVWNRFRQVHVPLQSTPLLKTTHVVTRKSRESTLPYLACG